LNGNCNAPLVRRRNQRLPGIHSEVCIGCGRDLGRDKEDDHIAGAKHGD
jgi:hypothetical protein